MFNVALCDFKAWRNWHETVTNDAEVVSVLFFSSLFIDNYYNVI